MRIVIVGGGTAGHMAAAHVSRHMPDSEVVHVFDRDRPTIGVGEGTTPDFLRWLGTIGVTIDDLTRQCQATRKRGLRFEGWGEYEDTFDHEFLPRSQQAVHFAAAMLPALLASRSSCTHINDNVQEIASSTAGSTVLTETGRCIEADLVIDARGFGLDAAVPVHRCDWITTDSAMVTKTETSFDSTFTLAIARPLGWVFCIPLANETSFGYVYNSRLSNQAEVRDDFLAVLSSKRFSSAGESAAVQNTFRHLSFPNFARRDIFDGRVLHIGNCASFLEPLEATAIGVITLQLHLLDHWRELLNQGVPAAQAVDRINRIHEDTLIKVSIFIAWHYAAGSQFDTPFWRNASAKYQQLAQVPALQKILQQFAAIQNRASEISIAAFAELNTDEDLSTHGLGELHQDVFGGYTKLSFAQLLEGLGLSSRSVVQRTKSRQV